MTYQLDSAAVDDGECAVADEVLGRVLVDAHALHLQHQDATDLRTGTELQMIHWCLQFACMTGGNV